MIVKGKFDSILIFQFYVYFLIQISLIFHHPFFIYLPIHFLRIFFLLFNLQYLYSIEIMIYIFLLNPFYKDFIKYFWNYIIYHLFHMVHLKLVSRLIKEY